MSKLLAISLLCLTLPSMHSQQPLAPHPAATQSQPATRTSAEDAHATREDLQRMKALVQQMQTNLAFVTSIQGPLKHQFELEIEMWQLEISLMERKLNSSGDKK